MSTKPIPFNADTVREILEGRKTMTRRAVKPQPPSNTHPNLFVDPPYQTGDILYVRETWAHPSEAEIKAGADPNMYLYYADSIRPAACDKWHPSIHMPKKAARIFLRVTGVRVERLQDITLGDCIKEGISPEEIEERDAIHLNASAKWIYEQIWDSTIKPIDRDKYGWEANPLVWVIEFERVGKEEIQYWA